VGNDTIGNQVFTGDETWDRNDDQDRESLMNQVLTENEDLLREAREAFNRRGSLQDRDPGVKASRFAMAYELLQQATWKAAQDKRSNEEKFDLLLQEFQDVTEPYGLTPSQLDEEARQSAKQHQQTAKLRRLLNSESDRMTFLTRKVISGTEAITEGVSDDEDEGPIDDEV
jgi:hypothetical protein